MKIFFNINIFLTLFFISEGISQIKFERAYFIDNSNIKHDCYIKNYEWNKNPQNIKYKLTENGQINELTPNDILEFKIENHPKYISHLAEVDTTYHSKSIANLSSHATPEFEVKKRFIKVIVQGGANLYKYFDGQYAQFYYNLTGSEIKPLIYKKYRPEKYTSANGEVYKNFKIYENTTYKRQLLNNLTCDGLNPKKIYNASYNEESLTKFFIKYNACKNFKNNITRKERRDLFNLTPRIRANYSSSSTPTSIIESRNINFDDRFSFGYGLEFEYILPFNKNKWSIIFEPVYQNFEESKSELNDNFSGGIINTDFSYSSIELHLGVRHFVFLNNKPKFFFNALYVWDITLDNSVIFTRADGSEIDSSGFLTSSAAAIGAGFKPTDYLTMEFRYLFDRPLLYNSSEYGGVSFIVGLTLF